VGPTAANCVITQVGAVAGLAAALRPGTDDHGFAAVGLGASGGHLVVALGATDRAGLFAAYSLVERLTVVQFRLHGDVVPDRNARSTPTLAALAEVGFTPRGIGAAAGQAFVVLSSGDVGVRGMQPFHDFIEGPDMWNLGEYQLLLDQMAKLKLNFIGLHNYRGEPTVWTGQVGTFDPATGHVFDNGTIPNVTYVSTASGGVCASVCHGRPMNTSDYLFGAQDLYASDCWSSDTMRQAGLCPHDQLLPPPAASDVVPLVDGVATLLTRAFDWARTLGHSTAVGIECGSSAGFHPLLSAAAPDDDPGGVKAPNATLVDFYKGTLARIAATHKASHFWVWTGEGWAPRSDQSLNVTSAAVQFCLDEYAALHAARDALFPPNADAAEQVGSNGDDDLPRYRPQLATGGWSVGPLANRSYWDAELPSDFIISSINENVGNTNVEPQYANITRHRKWSIPWMEDDAGLAGMQLWANRTLVFSKDAATLGVSGLLGIHWRTRDIAPQALALARWPWDRELTSAQLYADIVRGEFGLPDGSAAAAAAAEIFEGVDSYGPGVAPPRPGDSNGRGFYGGAPAAMPRPDMIVASVSSTRASCTATPASRSSRGSRACARLWQPRTRSLRSRSHGLTTGQLAFG
jgi:hypothetical protein